MLNEYVHEVEIGFNWWYVVMPAMAFLMFIYGLNRFALNTETLEIKVKKRYTRAKMKLLAALMSGVLMILIVEESVSGISQALINHLDNIAWFPFVAAVTLLSMTLMLYYAMYGVGRIGMYAGYGYLAEERKKLKAKIDAERRKSFKIITLKPENDDFGYEDDIQRLSPDEFEIIEPQRTF